MTPVVLSHKPISTGRLTQVDAAGVCVGIGVGVVLCVCVCVRACVRVRGNVCVNTEIHAHFDCIHTCMQNRYHFMFIQLTGVHTTYVQVYSLDTTFARYLISVAVLIGS